VISTIDLTNFKCFACQEVDLGAMTLLTGANGTGKSSVIQALLVLRQSYLQGSLQKGQLSLNGSLVHLGVASEVLFDQATTDDIGIGLSSDDGERHRWHFRYDLLESDVLVSDDPVTPATFDCGAVLFSDNCHYLAAERVGPQPAYDASYYEVSQRHQLGSHGEFAAHFLEHYGSKPVFIDGLKKRNARDESLKSQTEAWMEEVCPGTELELSRKTELDVVGLRYSFSTGRDRTKAFRATNVAFGLTYVLPILVATLSAKPGDLLIVENPEAHLHPRAQSHLAQLLAVAAGGGVQVIVETHSDHVLNGIRIAVAHKSLPQHAVRCNFFERDADSVIPRVVPLQVLSSGQMSSWPAGFFDEFDMELETLLGAKD
jgi:predicted ATPase